MNIQLTDEKGYIAQQRTIDVLALQLAASTGFVRSPDLAQELFKLGIGDATSSEKLALSYSSTGAIARTAITSLVGRSFLQHYAQPTAEKVIVNGRERDGIIWTQVITPDGRALLAKLTAQKGATA